MTGKKTPISCMRQEALSHSEKYFCNIKPAFGSPKSAFRTPPTAFLTS